MTKFDTVLVLCDEMWMDPDQNMTNGYDDINTQGDLLRLESVVRLSTPDVSKICSNSRNLASCWSAD